MIKPDATQMKAVSYAVIPVASHEYLVLSFVIAIITSYTALTLAGRVPIIISPMPHLWLTGCASVIEIGMGILRRVNELFTLQGNTQLRQANEQLQSEILEYRQAQEEVRFFQTMTQAISETSDFHTALGVTLQQVYEVTGWCFGEAWIPCPDSIFKCSPAWYGSTDLEKFRKQSEELRFEAGTSLLEHVWLSRQPEWIEDISKEPSTSCIHSQLAIAANFKAGLGIPIIAPTIPGEEPEILAVLVFFMFNSCNQNKRLVEVVLITTQLSSLVQSKRAESEIRHILAKEKQLSELKSRFMAITSHELRTGLTTIFSSAELLQDYGFKWSEQKKRQHLQQIQIAVQQMTRLLDDVLLISKAEAGKLNFNPAALDVVELCCDLVEEMQITTDNHEITFVAQGSFTNAYMDEKLLRHILSNLLSNAIKYSPEGGTVHLDLACKQEKVIFRVQDRGIGIPIVDQAKLFDSFYKASNIGTISGTGLGLAIVKKAVDVHSGAIAVESEVGVGTTFVVSLPLY